MLFNQIDPGYKGPQELNHEPDVSLAHFYLRFQCISVTAKIKKIVLWMMSINVWTGVGKKMYRESKGRLTCQKGKMSSVTVVVECFHGCHGGSPGRTWQNMPGLQRLSPYRSEPVVVAHLLWGMGDSIAMMQTNFILLANQCEILKKLLLLLCFTYELNRLMDQSYCRFSWLKLCAI